MEIGKFHTSFENESLLYTFPRVSKSDANGYYFTLSNCLMDACPVQWILEAYAEREEKWTTVGASTWRFNSGSASLVFFPSIPFKSHLSNGTLVSVDYVADWKWCAQFLAVNAVCALGWLLMALYAVWKREETGVVCWEMYLACLSIIYGGLCISNLSDGNWREAVVDCLWIMPVVTLSAGIHFFQNKLIYHLLMYGALQILAKICEGTLFPLSKIELILNVLSSTGFVVGVTCLILLVFRRRIMYKSRLLVERDCCFYEQLWSEILQNSDSVQDLHRLKDCVLGIRMEGSGGAVQLLRSCNFEAQAQASIASRSIQSFHSMFQDSETYSGHQKVDSLDQLYFQAHCLHPILLKKVENWAASWNGQFPVRNEATGEVHFSKWTDIQEDSTSRSRVCWAKVKSVERAIEKIVRTYKHVSFVFCVHLVNVNVLLLLMSFILDQSGGCKAH